MSVLAAAFLGLIQGVAEFLPISSSGHLSVFQHFFGLTTAEESSLFFDVLLHLGTLITVCFVYRKDIVSIISECIAFCKGVGHPLPGGKKRYPAARLLLMLFFATLPLFLILPIKDTIDGLYNSTVFIGIALILTGCMLFVADRMRQGSADAQTMTVKSALIVGVCQAVATMPGLSRSGTTITAGIATGMKRSFAVKFSFLLSIPAVLGANILSLVDAIRDGIDVSLLPVYLLGMLVAMVSGYFSLRLLRYVSDKGKFGWFAVYCCAAGLLTLLLTAVL